MKIDESRKDEDAFFKESDTPLYELIYAVVNKIPSGKVATYGQIARLVGGCSPRMVGYAMSALKQGTDVPWQRVINRLGKISQHGFGYAMQKNLLEQEGIQFDSQDKTNLERFGWQGPDESVSQG